MFERALSLRRKLLRALKTQLWLGKNSSLPRKSDAIIHKTKSDVEVVGLEPADDGVPQIKFASVRTNTEVIIRSPCTSTAVRTAPDIDAVPLRELASKPQLTIVIPPGPAMADFQQSPLSTAESSEGAGPSQNSSSPSPAQDSEEYSPQSERIKQQQKQLQRTAIRRARSMPLSFSDPMRKLRDSYVRIMHKMAQDEAKANPLSQSNPSVVFSDQSRHPDYLHRTRSPADEEEEEFCRLAVMRTKFNRSQSAL